MSAARRAALARRVANVGGSPGVDPRRTALAALMAATTAHSAAKALNPYVPGAPKVQVVDGPPPGAFEGAPTAMDPSTGTIYHEGAFNKFDRAHEVGHALDAEVLTDGDRHYFQRIMHAPPGAWDQGTGTAGYKSPDEWFADYYAASATHLDLGRQNVDSYAQLGPKRLQRFEKALARLGQRHNLKPYS